MASNMPYIPMLLNIGASRDYRVRVKLKSETKSENTCMNR